MDEKKKHEYRINLRLTEEEYTAIKQRIENDGAPQTRQNLSAGIRQLLRNAVSADIQEQPTRPRIDAELAQDIRGEIRKIGTNVNQLAKNLNAVLKRGETASRSTEAKLIASLDMVSQHLEDILQRVVELS